MALNLSVLDRGSAQRVIQLNRLDGSCTSLVLRGRRGGGGGGGGRGGGLNTHMLYRVLHPIPVMSPPPARSGCSIHSQRWLAWSVRSRAKEVVNSSLASTA